MPMWRTIWHCCPDIFRACWCPPLPSYPASVSQMSMGTSELDLLVPVTNQNDVRDHFPLCRMLSGTVGLELAGQEVGKLFGILSFGWAMVMCSLCTAPP